MTLQRKKSVSDTAAVADPSKELVDRLAGLLPEEELSDALKGLSPEEITGPGGLVTQLAGRVIETALEAEMTDHLSVIRWGRRRRAAPATTVTARPRRRCRPSSALWTSRPRATAPVTFEPQLVGKRQTRLAGLDEKILGLYAGGMSVRDIEAHLRDLYGDQGRSRHDQPRHRRCARGRAGVAHTAAGARLPDRVLRRADGQGARGPLRQDPRLLSGDRRQRRGRARGARHLVAGDRGRQVLAGRPERPAPPRRRGRPGLLRGRAHRVP